MAGEAVHCSVGSGSGSARPEPGAWVAQHARNLLMLEHRPLQFLICDRDAKFTRAFDDVVRSEGAEVLITPLRAPIANAYAERWIRAVRAECLDWLLTVGRGHLEQVLHALARAMARPFDSATR